VLKDKVATARVRLEALLARIPADDEEETSP
jgi:hypothetical protein